jgi:hypothetical protein
MKTVMPKTAQEIFENIYDKRMWGNDGDGSGGGSTLERCKPLIRWLSHYIAHNSITSMVDIGCGDLQWVPSLIERSNIKYTGIDCVSRLIESHRKKYETMTFLHSDLTQSVDILPPADMYFIKDVFQHWPTGVIAEFVTKLKAAVPPGSHILICDDYGVGRGGRDIIMGDWHPLHESNPPLNAIPHKRLFDFNPTGEGWNNKVVMRIML